MTSDPQSPEPRTVPEASAPGAVAASANGPLPHVPGFVLSEQLGEGGMGVVYYGRDLSLNRDVAVKVLHQRHLDCDDLRRRFVEEAQLTSQLQHPAIPPVYARGETPDGRPYFCMKVVKGRTLADLLASRANATDDQAQLLHVFEQVCQALAYAHSKGVIHRDLKPLNVMVGAFGEVQVMDWGLAKVLTPAPAAGGVSPAPGSVVETVRTGSSDGATQAGAVLGTYAYMPPEQARGEIDLLDERCDVFGLGAILCVVLTGQPPHAGADREAVRRRAAAGDLSEALGRLDSCGADAELVALCRDCLAPRREDRLRGGGVVAARMVAYQAAVQQRLRQAELERAAAKVRVKEEWKRRRLTRALRSPLIGIGLLLLAVCLIGAWQIRRLQADMAHLLSHSVASLESARELEVQVFRLRFYSFLYLLDPVPERLQHIDDAQVNCERALEQARAAAATDEDRALLREIEEGYHSYRDEISRLRRSARPGEAALDVRQLADAHPLRPAVEPCERLVKANGAAMARASRESEAVSARLSLALLLLGFGGSAGALLSGYGITRWLDRTFAHSE
jgi:tRNA A-37 threonylcarbamoyl transferase component Bud32